MEPARSMETELRYYGGIAGALAPFVVFFAGVAWLGISGAPNERGFWPILIAALSLAMVLCKDRSAWAEVVVAGMARNIVMIMVLAWLLASVLGKLMGASGFVDSLVWLSRLAGLSGGLYVAAAFLICCVVSTSVGTSLGTIILCAPLLYPAGAALEANPVILIGAILGGATFGDNVSPVSDTTIASAVTQQADMGGVVRSRLRYAHPAGAIALILYTALGGTTWIGPLPIPAKKVVTDTTFGPEALPMVVVPVLVLGLLLAKRHLLEGLLFGIIAATVLGLSLGLLEPVELFAIDRASFSAGGLIVDGMESGLGVSIFTILLMGLVAGIEATGLAQRMVDSAEQSSKTAASAEWRIFGTFSLINLITTHPTVTIITTGDFARRIGERFGIDRYRRANILDLSACSWPMFFPWFIPAIITSSTTADGVAYGMPRLGPIESGVSNLHSWALLAVLLFALSTGYGRTRSGSR